MTQEAMEWAKEVGLTPETVGGIYHSIEYELIEETGMIPERDAIDKRLLERLDDIVAEIRVMNDAEFEESLKEAFGQPAQRRKKK